MSSSNGRIHGIDVLRAITMILGMLLHATIAYKVEPIPTWPQDNIIHHWFFDFTYQFLHSFRMPLFFLIGGFFFRMLYYKIGREQFIKHRFRRIVIPFVFSIVFILPVTIFPFSFFKYWMSNQNDLDAVISKSLREIMQWNGMAHLWFLYYLIFFYVFSLLVIRIVKFFKFNSTGLGISLLSYINPGRTRGLIVYVILVWLILINYPSNYLHVDTGISPDFIYLLFYFIFFYSGWVINKIPTSLNWITRNSIVLTSVGSILSILIFYITWSFDDISYSGFLKVLISIQIVSLVIGILGLFLKYFTSESKFWKYISDASYWMYLIHLGIVCSLQIFFSVINLSPVLRFPLVLTITLTICLLSYHLFVRYTVLGEYLHGKRAK